MARTKSLAWSQLKIGILAVAALALAAMLIVAVGGQGGWPWNRYELKTRFSDVQGLKSGAVVRVAGVEVGKVTGVDFVGAEVEVRLEIANTMQDRITEESRAMIGSLSLLGEPIIDVSPSSAGRRLEDGEFIPSARSAGQIADVAEGATQSLEQARLLIQDLRAGRGTVGKLFTDDALYRDIQEFVSAAETVATTISRGEGTLGMLAKDPAAYRQLNAALANLQEMTRRINAGEGSLGRLMTDDELARSLAATSGSVERISGRLEKGEGTAGKLLTDQELYDRINALTGRLDAVVATLEKGEGTAGRLLQDAQLYENMNTTITEARSLLADIRKDPRKYLNVRVSIF
jgi:phospholipid/cholesterol/gamma-HCH transport system substrate-binding protein